MRPHDLFNLNIWDESYVKGYKNHVYHNEAFLKSVQYTSAHKFPIPGPNTGQISSTSISTCSCLIAFSGGTLFFFFGSFPAFS